MKTRFFNYLRFNRAERNGTLVLFLMAVAFFAIPEITHHLRRVKNSDFSPFQQEIQAFRKALQQGGNAEGKVAVSLFYFDPNTATFEDFVRLGLSEKVANIICNYRDKGGDFRTPSDFQKIWSLEKADYERLLPYIQMETLTQNGNKKTAEKAPPPPFAFDPNTASEADLKGLGLPDRTVKSILNYRSKGGQFRKKEDLEKIYTLTPEDYARIADYASFSSVQTAFNSPKPVTYAGGGAFQAKTFVGAIDINRASLEDWRKLPGIGETRARQLVNYREKLGGFRTVDQVHELSGLPDSVFLAIRPHLALSSNDIRKINLNTASVDDLDAHPYISKRQAALIVAYREQHGAFASVEDIGKMRAISDQGWLEKIRPYLSVD